MDAILINITHTLPALGVSLSTYLTTGIDASSFADIYWGATVVFLPVMWFLYFFLFEAIGGATPGKRSGNLKMIRKDGGKIAWWQAVIRAFLSFPEYNIIGAIFVWATPLKQRLADLVAGTLVVNREKIYKIEFLSNLIGMEFHDHRRLEFAKVTEGIVYKFGLVSQLELNDFSPQGDLVALKWNSQFQRGEFERIRCEIERRGGLVFPERSSFGGWSR